MVNLDRVLRSVNTGVLLLCVLVSIGFYLSTLQAQAVRFGQKLPSGPPKYYLRDGSPQWICAPYLKAGETKPSYSCAAQADVIAMILKEPPECPSAQ